MRRLGNSDLLVSPVGLGGNNFGRPGTATATIDGTRAVIDAAIERGVVFIDTAELYGEPAGTSESLLGQALRGRRDQVVIATKFGYPDGGPEGHLQWGPRGSARYLRRAVEGSLIRLGTDHIDLYQLHAPDPETPIGQTLEALSELVTEGLVRYLGHSNLSPRQVREADQVAAELGLPRFVSAQNEYSLLHREPEQELLGLCRELELGFLPYFPLRMGLLTGKYGRDGGSGRLQRRPEVLAGVDWDQLEAYRQFCDAAGVSMTEATFAWLLAQPAVSSVIAGATTPHQVHQNADAGQIRLEPDQLDIIGELFRA